MSVKFMFELVIAVVAVASLGYVVVQRLFLGRESHAYERPRDAGWDKSQESVIERAGHAGWQVDETPAPRPWPADLEAARQDPRECRLVVTGPDFESSSWTAREKMVGAGAGRQARVWLLRLAAPGVTSSVAVRRASRTEEARLLPERFEDRVVVEEEVGGLFAAGDYREVEARLAPLVDEIKASGSWVITAPGDVTVMATLEPDASGVEFRAGLARKVAAALSE